MNKPRIRAYSYNYKDWMSRVKVLESTPKGLAILSLKRKVVRSALLNMQDYISGDSIRALAERHNIHQCTVKSRIRKAYNVIYHICRDKYDLKLFADLRCIRKNKDTLLPIIETIKLLTIDMKDIKSLN